MKYKDGRLLAIDSKDRLSGSNIQFVTQPLSIQASGIALRSCSFAFNLNIFNNLANKLVMVKTASPNTLYTAVIEQGNYNIQQLLSALNAAQQLIVFTFNSKSNKIKAQATEEVTIFFSNMHSNLLLGRMMGACGFKEDYVVVLNLTREFPYSVNLCPIRYFDICSSALTQDRGSAVGTSGNTIARIHIGTVPPNSIFEWNESFPRLIKLNNERGIGAIDIALVSDIGAMPIDGNSEISLIFDLFT